jgi:hypothetical protein
MGIYKTLVALCIFCFGHSLYAQPLNPQALPSIFQGTIPQNLDGGLTLVSVEKRCQDCVPWREIAFQSLTEPVRVERVSVEEGYKAMYRFPGSQYFANVKVERSAMGRFDADREVIERALRHECRRKLMNVEQYVASNPVAREKLDVMRMPDRPYLEVEQGIAHGIEFLACTENAIGLISSTISQVQFFVPAKRITMTAYLLKQQKMHFSTIQQFRELRDAFIDSYAALLETKD